MRSSSDRTRVRASEHLRPYRIAALVLVVLGVLCLLVEVQSPSVVLWTGERTPGTNDGGVVYYTVDGRQRTLTAAGDAPARPVPVTVYADPDDSTKDMVSEPVRWFDAGFVLLPFLAAGAVLVTGLGRRRRLRVADQ